MLLRSTCAAFAILAATALAADEKPALAPELEKYQKFAELAAQPDAKTEDLIAACRPPAEAGIAGAQQALGVILASRNQGGDRTEGLQWLEKAAAGGSVGAAFALGGLLLQEDSPASAQKAGKMLQRAACAGYPPALQVLPQLGIDREKLACPPVPSADFRGEWIAEMKDVKSEVGDHAFQLKLVFADDGSVQVFANYESAWTEVKAGKFKVSQLGESISVAAMDSGWDFDGKWIETWTIQLMRTGPDEAAVAYLRTVNNPHLPESVTWKTFAVTSEGKARRSH